MKKSIVFVVLLSVAFSALAQDAPKKYGVKSGIVKNVVDVMGQKTETTSYFDEYGAVEATKSKVSVPGSGEVEIGTIVKDGKLYVVNYTTKEVKEMKDEGSINFNELTEETIAANKIQEVGKEFIGDKECTKYTQEINNTNPVIKVTLWVWKGITLKTVTSYGGMEIVSEAKEVIEDAAVAPETFSVPAF